MDFTCSTAVDAWGALARCRLVLAGFDGCVLWGAEQARRLLAALPQGSAPDLEAMVKEVVAETLAQAEQRCAGSTQAELADHCVSDRLGCRAGLVRDAAGEAQAVLIELRAEPSDHLPLAHLLRILNHEIRTPLSSLHGFAELMLTREFDESQKRFFLQTIREESSRLAAILEDFIELQRIESGKSPLKLEMVDFAALVRRMPEKAADRSRVRLRLPAGPVKTQVDPSRMHRVLEILTANALRSSGSPVRVSLTVAGQDLVVSVADSGPVIPSEALPQLFSRSYRPLQVNWPRFGGFSMPLARSIVEAHHGEIRLESSPNGNVFSVRLPL